VTFKQEDWYEHEDSSRWYLIGIGCKACHRRNNAVLCLAKSHKPAHDKPFDLKWDLSMLRSLHVYSTRDKVGLSRTARTTFRGCA